MIRMVTTALGSVMIAAAYVYGGVPLVPQILVAAMPLALIPVSLLLGGIRSMKRGADFRVAAACALWAAAAGASVSRVAMILLGVGFGCLGCVIGSAIESRRR